MNKFKFLLLAASLLASAPAMAQLQLPGNNLQIFQPPNGGFTSGNPLSPLLGGTGVSNNAASTLTFSGAFGATFTLAGTTGVTFPTSGTLAILGANTFTGAQTFPNSGILLLGSSTGKTTFTSANSSATNYTLTTPAATGTVQVTGGCSIASATTTDIGTCPSGQLVTVSGTTTITSLGSTAPAGSVYALYFSGALSLTNSGTLNIAGSASFTTVANSSLYCYVPVTPGTWYCSSPVWTSVYALTAGGGVTAARVTVNSSSAPANGIYLPAASTLGLAANSTLVAQSTSTLWTQAAPVVSGGTKFTTTGCSISATTGGGAAGTFTLGANTCTAVITINGATGATAPNGWNCFAADSTGLLIVISQSGSSTTTCSLNIPATAGATDVIRFWAVGY